MSCSCESLCLVDEGSGSRSLRWAISVLIRSRRILLAPFVDFPLLVPADVGITEEGVADVV